MSKELQIVAPSRDRLPEIFDLTAKCFTGWGYWDWVDNCPSYFADEIYDWQTSRIGLIDGQVVTHCGVWDHQMRIGRSVVRVAGVGAVATHGHFRKQGLVSKTILACIDAMTPAGYDMTGLFGLANFYHRFGYVRGWDHSTLFVKTIDLPVDSNRVTLRKFRLEHRDDMARLYNRQNAGLTGTAVRPTFPRSWIKSWEGYLWNDAKGRLAGYVVVAPATDKLHHIDSAGDPQLVLEALRLLSLKQGTRLIELFAQHQDSPLARAVRRSNCRLEVNLQRSGGPMIRTVNLNAALGKIAGELGERLRRSALGEWRGELLVADARERVALRIDRSQVSVAERPAGRAKNAIRGGEEIAQLLIGAAAPDEIAEAWGTKLSGDGRQLLAALFPEQHPMLGRWDGY